MAKIIAIDRKLRHLDRQLVLDTDDATCCCGGPVYLIFRDCCTAEVTFAVREDIAQIVLRSCPPTRFLYVFKIDGRDQCNFHDPIAPTRRSRVDLFYVQALGIPIIEDAGRLSCVPTLQSNNWARCYTTTCPVCDTNCCLRGFYRKRCPVLETGGGESLVCCNFGNNPTATYYWNKRVITEGYISLNNRGSLDPFCPEPVCYPELFRGRSLEQDTGTLRYNFRTCDDDGIPLLNGRGICLSRNEYRLEERTFRRYGFDGTIPWATNCLQYVDDVVRDENRITDCGDADRSIHSVLPGYPDTWFPRFRAVRTLPFDNGVEACTELILMPAGPTTEREVCSPVSGHVGTCTRRIGGYLEVTTYTTSFDMTIGCGGGRFYFEQYAETRAQGQMECPEPGSLIGRKTTIWEATYSINIPTRRFCDTDMCDGFATEPGGGGPFVTPVGGALGLL